MGDDVDNEGRSAQRIGEDDDRWRCSLCGGYVRGNAPMCKHCHAQFGAPEPIPPKEDPASRHPRRQSPWRGALAFVLWLTGAAAVYGCWRVGTTLGGVAGSVTSPLLFTTIFTLLFVVWMHAAYRLPWSSVRDLVRDVVGVWTISAVTIALPTIACFVVYVAIDGWVGESLSLLVLAVVAVTAIYYGTYWRRLFDGPVSDMLCSRFEPKEPYGPYPWLMAQLVLLFVLPVIFFNYIQSEYPSPYSGLAAFARLMWMVTFVHASTRRYVSQFVTRSIRRLPLRHS